MSSQVMDMDELMEIMDHDQALVQDCFNDFINDSPGMLKKIKEAIETKSFGPLEKSAHALKGSLRYLAAHRGADVAFTLEQMGANGDLGNADSTYETLENECQKISDFMRIYKFDES